MRQEEGQILIGYSSGGTHSVWWMGVPLGPVLLSKNTSILFADQVDDTSY